MNSNTLIDPRQAEEAGEIIGADGNNTPHLVFEVDSQPYACPINKIQHLARFIDVSLRPSPAGHPAWEVGRLVTEMDAEGIPVVSLRALWGLPRLSETADLARKAVLIVTIAGQEHVLLVDNCRCVLPQLPSSGTRFHLSSALQSASGRSFKLATPWQHSLLVVLELDKLLGAAPQSVSDPLPDK